jgi:tetratricopeptide (TPR) repeat protein
MTSWRDIWPLSRPRDQRQDGAIPTAQSATVAQSLGARTAPPPRLPAGLRPWASDEQLCNGEFRVERLLGVGGFGAVYLVRNRIALAGLPGFFMEGAFAVKRIAVRTESEREALLLEVQTWTDLPDHPHVLPCRFVRTEPREVLIFTTYMAGGSLRDLVTAPQRPDADRVLVLAQQSISGLIAVHNAGLLHLDLKPGNMLLDDKQTLRIADFGLAAERSEPRRGVSNGRVVVRGLSPRYAPPEQRHGGNVSVTTDIYSWAASMLELLAGPTVPLTRAIVDRGERAGAIPVALGTLLRDCLDPDPRRRPSVAQEVARRLAPLAANTGGVPADTAPSDSRARHVAPGFAQRTALWQEARRRLLHVRVLVDDLRFEALRSEHGASPQRAPLDALLRRLTHVELSEDAAGQGLTPRGQQVRALRMLEAARTAVRDLVGLGYAVARTSLAEICIDLHAVYAELGDWNVALGVLAEAEAVLSDAAAQAPDPAHEALLWQVRRRRCVALSTAGMQRQALEYLLALPLPSLESQRAAPPALASAWILIESDRAVILLSCGRAADALAAIESALARASVTPSLDALRRAPLLLQRGRTRDTLGDPNGALEDFADAAAVYETHTPENADPEFLVDASGALLAQAVTLSGLKRAAEAIPLAERCVAIRTQARSSSSAVHVHHGYAFACMTAGDIYRQLGLADLAERAYREAVDVWSDLVLGRGRVELKPYLSRAHAATLGDYLAAFRQPP